jgi:hypothetical protein
LEKDQRVIVFHETSGNSGNENEPGLGHGKK